MQDLTKAHYIGELWRQFFEKIRREWLKYRRYGDSPEDVAARYNQMNFARAVKNDLDRAMSEKGITGKSLSLHTLHRYFQRGNISANVKERTLELLSLYLNYRSWGHFQQQNRDKLLLAEAENRSPPEGRKKPHNASLFFPRRMFLLSLLLLFLFTLALAWWLRQEDHYRRLIREAAAFEFRAYGTLPELDTAGFHRYYTAQGMAGQDILGLLNRGRERGRRLLQPPSSHRVLRVRLTNFSCRKAEVETMEKWHLLWCDPQEPRGWLYDTLNRQTYYLVREEGRWKIDVNHFEGRARHPATPPCR